MDIKKTTNINTPPKISFKNDDKGARVDKMQAFINDYIDKAEFQLTDIGFFGDIEKYYNNENPLRHVEKIGLKISPDGSSANSQKRILKAVVTSENNRYEMPHILKEGSRDEILAYLKADDFQRKFENYVTKCSDKFFNDDNIV